MGPNSKTPDQATQAKFEATRWTLIIEARSPDAGEALNHLCQVYWPPIYAFIRGQGYPPSDAADLAQGFFHHVFENRALGQVAPEKGTFRSFLRKSLANYLNSERDRLNAKKRGGAKTIISINAEAEEGLHPLELVDKSDPVKLYDRRWALALIDEALASLEQKSSLRKKPELFAQLRPYLTGDVADDTYVTLAKTLQMTEGTVKTALHRLRREFGELLRIEIRHTLANPTEQDVHEELRHLFACLGG